MAKVIANLTLDTYQRNRLLPLIVPQGDYGAREVHARITSNGNFVKIEKTDAVSIIATRTRDGESLAFSGIINDDGSVNVPITQWMLDIPESEVKCHIEITGNGYEYSTNEFLIEPQEKANPTEITEDDPRVDVVTEVLVNENARQVAESARTQNENLRIDAENLRNIAEEQRLIDEEKRIENEIQRISAENYRDTTFKNWSNEIALLPNMSDRISRNDKRITNLEQGLVPSPFETDDSIAYIKDVPLNALPYAEVSKVGGMTYKDGNALKNAKVTALKITGANLFNDIEWFTNEGFTKLSDGSWTCNVRNKVCWTNTTRKSGAMYINAIGKTQDYGGAVMYLEAFYTDGSEPTVFRLNSSDDFILSSMVTDASKIVDYVLWSYGVSGIYYLKGVSISFAETSEYIPYTETSFPIPEEVQPTRGINDEVYDFIEWREDETTKSHKCVGEVDMGTLNWEYEPNSAIFYAPVNGMPRGGAVLCALYRKADNGSDLIATDKSILAYYSYYENAVNVHDSAYTDAATFKAAMSGVTLCYELATPEVTDISDIISADNYIEVEGGGMIIAVNEYEYAVPTEITYQIKEATL